MDLGQKGVFWFTDALSPTQLIELAQRTEQLGYTALWYPEALSYELFGLGGFLLSHTKELIIASGIANIYARDATATKQGQHTLAKLYGRAVPFGVGGLPCAAGPGCSWPPVPSALGNDEGLPRHHGESGCDSPLTRQSTADCAGSARPPNDCPSWAADCRCVSLQRHPRAHSTSEGHYRPGQMALRRAKGASRRGPRQGTGGGATGHGVLLATDQLSQQLAASRFW